jgi:hypothetical protein
MKQGLLIAVALGLLAGCGGGGSGRDAAQDQRDAAQQQKDCADPAWKEAHLGLWYTACRPNAAIR